MNGRPPTGINALGIVSVSGRIRVASPPARIKHCTLAASTWGLRMVGDAGQQFEARDVAVEVLLLRAARIGWPEEQRNALRQVVVGGDANTDQRKALLGAVDVDRGGREQRRI